MILLFIFIPVLAAYILPHDRKQIDSEDQCVFGEGAFGKICSITIDSHEFVIKTPHKKSFEKQEIASLLYTASRSTPFVIRPTLVSFSSKGFELGLPKMLGSFDSAIPPNRFYKANLELQQLISEQTLIDVIKGAAELRKIGIAHNDLHYANVVLDSQGHIYIIDFGISQFMPVETFERSKTLKSLWSRDNEQFTSFFAVFQKFFKQNNIKVENDWDQIFSLLDIRNPDFKTFGWIAKQIKNNYFKLNK